MNWWSAAVLINSLSELIMKPLSDPPANPLSDPPAGVGVVVGCQPVGRLDASPHPEL